MSVGDFTASSIAMEQDSKDDSAGLKKGLTDYSKVEADIKSNRQLAKQVFYVAAALIYSLWNRACNIRIRNFQL